MPPGRPPKERQPRMPLTPEEVAWHHRQFIRRLVARRQELGLNRSELAERTDHQIKRQTLDAIESGEVEPRLSTMRALARALEMDPAELAFGRGGAPEEMPEPMDDEAHDRADGLEPSP